MRNKGRWLACVAAALGLGLTGCQTWVGGMTLPSGRYLEHYPQYFPPDPAFPLPRELATQTDPAGTVVGGAGGVGGPAVVAPGLPVPVGGVTGNSPATPGSPSGAVPGK